MATSLLSCWRAGRCCSGSSPQRTASLRTLSLPARRDRRCPICEPMLTSASAMTRPPDSDRFRGSSPGSRITRDPHAIVVPCDAPLLRPALIRGMVAAIGDAEVLVPEVGGRLQTAFGVWSTACVGVVREALRSDDRSLHGVLRRLQTRVLSEDEVRACDPELLSFLNVNTPMISPRWRRGSASIRRGDRGCRVARSAGGRAARARAGCLLGWHRLVTIREPIRDRPASTPHRTVFAGRPRRGQVIRQPRWRNGRRATFRA